LFGFLVGLLVNKFLLKRTGIEIIPGAYTVKHMYLFTRSCCRWKGAQYEEL
jgi:hypothetical protein